ncbi:MAG TPA: hypothetical protein VFH95_08025 [Candidatus Kapabacteria bacterium]|nr:hypothetical protein [Candidatus Kapabacteria bacterium]
MNHLRRFFPLYTIAATLVAILISSGCSSSTANNGSTVTMQSQLAASDVDRAMPVKIATPASLDFDSIVITNAIVFVSDVKLHSDVEDTNSDAHDQEIKTGPFVIVFDSSGTHIVTSATIPAGTYDRIKFEFHKPGKGADATILNQYPMLQNGGQTYSVWIYGYTVKAGVRTSFSVTSIRSENITLRFKDKGDNDLNNIVLNSNTTANLLFELDPRIVFHLGGNLFDPRDLNDHQKDIDNNILVAIRVVEF